MSSQPSWIRVALLLTSCAFATASCGVPLNGTPVNVAPQQGTTTTVVAGPASPVVPAVRVFFLRNGRFSALERQGIASPSQPGIGVQEALNFLRTGVFSSEIGQGFTSPVQQMDEVDFPVIIRDGVAQINVTDQLGALRQLPDETARLIVAQVALTALLGSPGVGGVTFESEGGFIELNFNGDTRIPPFHLDDFDCLEGSATCNLAEVRLPPVAGSSENPDQVPGPNAPLETVPKSAPDTVRPSVPVSVS
jgi:hypothetical protein